MHAKNKKEKTFLFQAWQTHASYNSDPGHRYKLRVIQVNWLTQVFNSQRRGSAEQDSNASYRLEDSLQWTRAIHSHSVATSRRPRQTSVVGSRVKFQYFWRTAWTTDLDPCSRLIGHAITQNTINTTLCMNRLGMQLASPQLDPVGAPIQNGNRSRWSLTSMIEASA